MKEQEIHELEAELSDLEARLDADAPAELRARVRRIVETLEARGDVPASLAARRQKAARLDDEIEAQFDNLPV